MGLLGKFIVFATANLIAILAADYVLADFSFSGDFKALLSAAAILAVMQLFVKPVLKLFFGPLIILSLGLFIIVINAITLEILDFLSRELTIEGYMTLLYGTLIVSAVHLIVSGAGNSGKSK